MDIFITQKTKDLAFEKLLNYLDYEKINYLNRSRVELNENELRKLVYILDDLVQERELDKILSK